MQLKPEVQEIVQGIELELGLNRQNLANIVRLLSNNLNHSLFLSSLTTLKNDIHA